MADKGWYPDPTGPAGQRRYWDGWAWTPQTTPAPASRSGSTMMLVIGAAVTAFLLVCGLLGAVVLAVGDQEPDRATSADAAQSDDTDEDDPTDEDTDDATSDDATDDEPEAEPVTEEAKPKKQRKARTYLVTNVVDGDTVDLDNGETVRLAGIDTPECGACGHQRAADALARFVLGKRVTLVASDEDRDQYDRLLRYIDVGKADAGLRLVKRGLAIARYDSRDGYGRHPREDRYVAADEGSPDVKCQPKPKPQPFVDPGQGSDCEAGYDPCVPHYPPDLDCADVGPVTVTGNDPHGLDGDGDGRACGGD